MEKKRILLVHNFYQIGGGEHTVFENEKAMLLENGHQVYTYTRSNDELKKSKWKLLLLPFSTTWSLRTWREVRRIVREKNIDIVHCHNTFPLISPSVYYAARSGGAAVVQTIHNFRFLCPNGLFFCDGKACEDCREQNSFLPALKKGCYRNSKIQTAVAVAMLKIHRWLGTYRKINYIFLTEFNRSKFDGLLDVRGENLFVKPNFVGRAQAPGGEIRKKFVFAGRLDGYKGIGFLVEAWKSLPREYELHIYGDGEHRALVEAAAAECPNIRWFGFRPQTEVFTDLSTSAALVFPSTCYETYPMILAEAFSMGRPVVAADLGNHGDIVRTSGGGTLFSYGDAVSFRKAVETVVQDNEDYSRRAAAYYENHQTKEKNYEKLSEIYDKIKPVS